MPKPRILLCQNILRGIILQEENIQDNFLETYKSELEIIYQRLTSHDLINYLPLPMVSYITLYLEHIFDNQKAKQLTQKILRVSNFDFDLDYDLVLKQVSQIKTISLRVNFIDLINLVVGQLLELDYIVSRYPNHLINTIDNNLEIFKSFNTDVVSIDLFEDELRKNNHLKNICLSKTILTFTPKDRVIELPIDSTPVDFAYSIHTEIGHTCREAKVNKKNVDLNYKLKTRDVVEIIQGKEANPQIEWLKFIKTNIAKEKITHWHRQTKTNQGWECIRNTFGHNRQTYKRQLEYASSKIPGCKSLNDLAYKIGSRNCSIQEVEMFMEDFKSAIKTKKLHGIDEKKPPLLGVEGQNWKIARCCNPLPREALIGIIPTNGRKVSIHNSNCDNLKKIDNSKKFQVEWNCDYCLIILQLQMDDRKDILRKFLNYLAEKDILLDLRSLTTYPNKTFRASFVEIVRSREDLEHILTHIKSRSEVKQVKLKSLIPGAVI